VAPHGRRSRRTTPAARSGPGGGQHHPLNSGAYARRSKVNGLPGERLDGLGVAIGLASACWYTLYVLVGEYLLRGVDPLAAGAYITSGAACSFLAAAVVVGGRGIEGATPAAYAAGVAMAVVGTAVAIAAFLAGLARVGVGVDRVVVRAGVHRRPGRGRAR